jgi:hypothetical protein
MTAVSLALRIAGVKTPTVKARIWNWLRDHSEKTCEDVQKGLGLNYPPSQALVDMERDGILTAYSDMSRKIGITGVTYRTKRYSVTSKDEYPETMRKTYKRRAKVTPFMPVEVARELAATTPQTKLDFDPAEFMLGVSLEKCKAVYVYLHGVFK